MRVVDLFCGAGGISEGLRQAGFQIIYAVDKDRAAVETFRNNHPRAKVERLDVSSFDVDQLPEFDVLVGGPPCIEFSASKQGRGNILEGLRLVQAYLRVVYERQPKYWIMENVPRIVMHLPEEIPLSWIGIDKPGSLHVPVRTEFNTADFGVPQARRRFLMGSFPIPSPSHSDPASDPLLRAVDGRRPWRTLGEVLESLPDPLSEPPVGAVRDPNYDLSVPRGSLADHFHDVVLKPDEARRIRMVKTAHPYMGAMGFPDDPARPARTVVATQLGRETLVIRAKDGHEVFRRATVRECASLQSFPITYQFFGESLNARYRLVGDAVPPMLTYLIGCEILRAEGMALPSAPLQRDLPTAISAPVPYRPRRTNQQHPMNRKFRALVPGKDVRGCRVELDNLGSNPVTAQLLPEKYRHIVEWTARLHVGEGKRNMKSRVFSLQDALHEISGYCRTMESYQGIIGFLESIVGDLHGILCDASTLQAVWVGRKYDVAGPEDVAEKLSALIDTHFPKPEFHDERVPRSGRFDLIPAKGLRIRLAAALVGTAYACELINRDSSWAKKNPTKRFVAEGWPSPSNRNKGGYNERLNPLTLFEDVIGHGPPGLFTQHTRAGIPSPG